MIDSLILLSECKVFREISVKGFDAKLYQTDQVFYSSKDGEKIPMFIVHKKASTVCSSCLFICCCHLVSPVYRAGGLGLIPD